MSSVQRCVTIFEVPRYALLVTELNRSTVPNDAMLLETHRLFFYSSTQVYGNFVLRLAADIDMIIYKMTSTMTFSTQHPCHGIDRRDM